jgi:hypothetical protein
MRLSRVVFPDPLGPMIAQKLPCAKEIETPRSADTDTCPIR